MPSSCQHRTSSPSQSHAMPRLSAGAELPFPPGSRCEVRWLADELSQSSTFWGVENFLHDGRLRDSPGPSTLHADCLSQVDTLSVGETDPVIVVVLAGRRPFRIHVKGERINRKLIGVLQVLLAGNDRTSPHE